MRKLAVLTSLVFLFGIGTFAMAEDPAPVPVPVNEVNGNDIVQAGDAAANDGGTAVVVKDNLNGNSLFSGNSASSTHTSSNNSKSNADNYNKQEVEAVGKGNAATMTGNATADSRDQSTHTKVEAEAEEGSLAAINTGGSILYDKSTTITISDIGLALQKNELKGEVEKNVLIVGGPEAKSITVSGETESGETESGEAKSGATLSGAKSKSGSAAVAGASSGSKESNGFPSIFSDEKDESAPTSASANSNSGSSADSSPPAP